MPDVSIVASEVAATPQDYTLPGAQEILLRAVGCTMDGASASGTFLPALQMLDPAGHVMWTAVNDSLPVAAGRSALVSWFPGGGIGGGSSSTDQVGITDISSPAGTLTVGNPAGPATTLDLATSGVTAGTYGDATHVAQVAVNADGIVTAASNINISGIAGTGLTLLFDSTLGGSAASIDTGANAIATGHMGLIIYVYVRTSRVATADNLLLRFNGDSGTNYDWQQTVGANAGVSATTGVAQTGLIATVPSSTGSTNSFGLVRFDVFNYDGSVGYKAVLISTANPQTVGAQESVEMFAGEWRNTGAVNQVAVSSVTGSNLLTGTRMSIFGVQ